MKVLSFNPIAKVGDNELLGEVLRKHINNDAIFDTCYIGVSISIDQPEDFFYRNLWETVYLRYPSSSIRFNRENHIDTRITVGEAISFINAVTPPLFKNKTKELISSVDEIVESLETYLMTNDDQLEYNLSVFRKYIHLERFRENITEYNFARMKALREFHPNGIIIDVEATNVPYTDICKGIPMPQRDVVDTSSTTIPHVQLMVNCHTKEELTELANRISYKTSAWRVIDFFEDPEMGYFIEIFSKHYVTSDSIYPDPDYYDTCDDFFRNIIKETYKPLMKD